MSFLLTIVFQLHQYQFYEWVNRFTALCVQLKLPRDLRVERTPLWSFLSLEAPVTLAVIRHVR